ncbi:hypothetical protein DRN74_00070 [Candidatus Micrarchaeota archaeon]|nr:MAG: hypothetical protein DRN74_00070 [Candidatus Micrarchaeota archaeon]
MRLSLDREKCTDCGACLESCPMQPRDVSISQFLNCPCEAKPCLSVCPEKAIEERNGAVVINRKKCNDCGKCIEVCPNHAIGRDKDGHVVKCDMGFSFGYPKCVQTCPYNAIKYELTEEEKEKISEWIGWEKSDEAEYKADVRRIGFEEARIIHNTIKIFRREFNDYDENIIRKIINAYCDKKNIEIEKKLFEKIVKQVESEIRGYGVLDLFLNDDDLEEIAVIGSNKPIYVYHKDKGWLKSNVTVTNEQKIIDLANKMSRDLGRRITMQKPRINANIKLGRIHAGMRPVAFSGACLTIRKFRRKLFSPEELVQNQSISKEALHFLAMAMKSDVSIMVVGNTGSGKTTLMNALFDFIPLNERIIIVEETPEINVKHPHQIRLTVSEDLDISMHELIEDTLRMRPDRVIVGEIRSPEEVKAFINTMLAGQGKASYATFHAQNAEEALIRMQSMGINPMDLNALDLIVSQRRWSEIGRTGEVRRVVEIASVEKNYRGSPRIKHLFKYDMRKKKLEMKTLEGPAVEKICLSYGIKAKDLMRTKV